MTTQQQKQALKIAALCIQVSAATPHDAFFWYSGHIDNFVCSVKIGGWHSPTSEKYWSQPSPTEWPAIIEYLQTLIPPKAK